MLIVDDILLSPYRGLMWIFKEIHRCAEEELAGEPDRIQEALTDLYMQLETGRITEEEFDEQEAILLGRLDAIEGEMDEDEGHGSATEDGPSHDRY